MIRVILLLVSLGWLVSTANAQTSSIVVSRGTDNPIVISVPPFNFTGAGSLPESVDDIISNNLYRSGQFAPIEPTNMLSFPATPEEVVFRDWRLLASEYLVIGNISPGQDGYQLVFSLYDVITQKALLFNEAIAVGNDGLRDMAHYVSDIVYETITAIPGAFSTDIIYVERQKSPLLYRLIRADIDGARPQTLLESTEPVLSPSWSPDGNSVVYTSYETGRAAIFLQNLATGQREQLTNFTGLNSAPSFSPDGSQLALVLSKDGNPEIYTFDLSTRVFTRITNHFGIDTEPDWTLDGQSIVFTSNRGGKPQIYKVDVNGGYPQRLTFEGDYNARAQVTPDGKYIIVVHQRDKVFHIASQELATGTFRLLTTETELDESPSIAPNGASLIYATKAGGKGIVASVSLDAGTRFTVPLTANDVREPAWSPFFK